MANPVRHFDSQEVKREHVKRFWKMIDEATNQEEIEEQEVNECMKKESQLELYYNLNITPRLVFPYSFNEWLFKQAFADEA